MKKISLICLGFFLVPYFLLAAGDEFTIKALVGDDLIPPTTPTLLSVVPVAQTQIDVSWSTAVDNFILSGYVLLRDGLAIATTTLTTFVDTGLTAETLYAYEVYAFDSFGNISTTSNQLATTTLAVPIVATSSPTVDNPNSSTRVVALKDLQITTDTRSARLRWQTNFPARYALRWGQTESYTGGYVLNDIYQTDSETTITDLEPGTKYYYELVGFSPNGIEIILRKGQFTTEASKQPTYIPNVNRLEGIIDGNDVILRWLLPDNIPLQSIRVVRSHLGFPTDINDGAIIFDGINNNLRDVDAFAFHEKQYYTVFVISEDGTISSGAVVVMEKFAGLIDTPDDTPATTSSSSIANPNEEKEIPLFGLSLENIMILQNDQAYSFLTEQIDLVNSNNFTLSIAREALPDHLKSIVVTLLDPTDQRRSYSFLLRINKEGNAYEATIAPLQIVGASRLEVEIYDFERKIIGRYRKPINFLRPYVAAEPVFFPDALLVTTKKSLPILVVMLMIFGMFMFVLWRRHNHNLPINH